MILTVIRHPEELCPCHNRGCHLCLWHHYFSPIILTGKLRDTDTPLNEIDGYRNLSAGLAVGLACLCSGAGMGRFKQQVARPVPFVPTTTNPEHITGTAH
eukprot:scaffold95537_cov26-Attheya_sp.AAC.1